MTVDEVAITSRRGYIPRPWFSTPQDTRRETDSMESAMRSSPPGTHGVPGATRTRFRTST